MTIKERELELFDESSGYEDDTGIVFNTGLSVEDRIRGTFLYNYFNELMGLMLVIGDPGNGKDVFGNYLQYTLKRYFPDKKYLRDEKPRMLFGEYDGLFNPEIIQDDLAKMRLIAQGNKSDDGINLEKAADDWVSGKGEVMLMKSILYLTEYHRYVYNREPHNPMNKTMGAIHKVKRHLDNLTIGTTQQLEDLDKKTCKPWVDWLVHCKKSASNISSYNYVVEKVKYDKRRDEFISLPYKPLLLRVDAGKPRSFIGDGKIVVKKPNYKPVTEEERIVLDVIKAGCNDYDVLVNFIETEGDMDESEILETLKDLCLKIKGRRPKFAIWYPCFYFIFNSKSAPQIKSSVRVGD